LDRKRAGALHQHVISYIVVSADANMTYAQNRLLTK
jgi:hypothetical protein